MPPPIPVLNRGQDETWRCPKHPELNFEIIGELPASPYAKHIKGSALSDMLIRDGLKYVACVGIPDTEETYYMFYYVSTKKMHTLQCLPNGEVCSGGTMSKLGSDIPRGMIVDWRIRNPKNASGSPVNIASRRRANARGSASASVTHTDDSLIDSKAMVTRAMDVLATWSTARVAVPAPDSILDDAPVHEPEAHRPLSAAAAAAAAAAEAAAHVYDDNDTPVPECAHGTNPSVKDEVMAEPEQQVLPFYVPNGPLIMEFMGHAVDANVTKKLLKSKTVMSRCASTLLCRAPAPEMQYTSNDGKKTLTMIAGTNGFMIDDSTADKGTTTVYAIKTIPQDVADSMPGEKAISGKGLESDGGKKALIAFVNWAVSCEGVTSSF